MTDPLIKPDEYHAGFLGDDGGFVVGASEAADGVQALKEGQGYELGFGTDGASQQPRSAESRNLLQVRDDLAAIVLLIPICLIRARPASPQTCDYDSLLLDMDQASSAQRGPTEWRIPTRTSVTGCFVGW